MLDRAAVRAGGRAITEELLSMTLGREIPTAAIDRDCTRLTQLPIHESVAAWERLLIKMAIKDAQGNKSDAAWRLGINRRLLS